MRMLIAILSLGMTIAVSSASAAVIGPVSSYDALKEAIETAQKGDTVKIAAGRIVFPAAIAVDKDLTLEGATDGKSAYWYDETTRKYRSLSARKTSSATVAGIDDATPLIPDGYGAARRRNHVALGPLNKQPSGLQLIVR